MSLFGKHLKSLVESNKINIYSLAKQAGLERTTIHKIISHGRIPSEEYVKKLSMALPLSPQERIKFLESYYITSIGEYTYKQRLQVKELIESISQIEKIFKTDENHMIRHLSLGNVNIGATGNFAVNNLVKSAISESLTNENNQAIDFVVNENYQYFYDELLATYVQNPQVKIRHIVPFSKKVDFIENTNLNIKLLSHILPLAFVAGFGYIPSYFYKSTSEVELTQAMPYFIITSTNKVVLLNKEFTKGALICDAPIVNIYKESFETMVEAASPLTKNFTSVFDTLEHYISLSGQSGEYPLHWIEPEPCIGPLLTEKWLEAMIKPNIPNRDELKALAYRNYKALQNIQLKNINICTTDGTARLIETGLMYYAPKEIADPLPPNAIKEILTDLAEKMANNKAKVLFSNPSKFVLPNKTFMTVSRKSGINFIMKKDEESRLPQFTCIGISEDSINEAFADFVESIEESDLVYNKEDSAAVLKSIIESLAYR